MRIQRVEKKKRMMLIAMLAGCFLFTAGCANTDISNSSKPQNQSTESVKAETDGTADTVATTEAAPASGAASAEVEDEARDLGAGTEQSNAIPDSIAVNLGESRDIAAAIRENSSNLQLSCADETVLKILEDGSVFGLSPGKAQVSIQSNGRNYQTQVKVKKRGMVYPSFTMMQKEVLDLQFSSGRKAADYDWSSSDTAVAKVSKEGKIKGKGIGTAVVTGIAKDQSDRYRCEVTVTKKVEKAIYLTFDDGPNRYSTPKILDILKKNDVKATFFELKPAKKDFDLTERVLKEGHTLAMHGYQHKYDQIYKSERIYHENLDKLRTLFFNKFGVWCTLTRFPGGSSNMVSSYNPGIMTKLTKELDGWGYHYFDWNVSSGDAGGATNSDQVYRNFKRELSKEHASVVLMHDFYKNDKTINALNRIIKYGKKHGYTFLPLTASTEEVHHKVNN